MCVNPAVYEMFSLLHLESRGVRGFGLLSGLHCPTVGLQCRSNSQGGVMACLVLCWWNSWSTAQREVSACECWGRTVLGLAQKSFFHWKTLAQLLKQPVTATSLSIMMVLIKISSSLLQVVVLKLFCCYQWRIFKAFKVFREGPGISVHTLHFEWFCIGKKFNQIFFYFVSGENIFHPGYSISSIECLDH